MFVPTSLSLQSLSLLVAFPFQYLLFSFWLSLHSYFSSTFLYYYVFLPHTLLFFLEIHGIFKKPTGIWWKLYTQVPCIWLIHKLLHGYMNWQTDQWDAHALVNGAKYQSLHLSDMAAPKSLGTKNMAKKHTWIYIRHYIDAYIKEKLRSRSKDICCQANRIVDQLWISQY